MTESVVAQHEELRRHIRSLSSILHQLTVQKSPSRQKNDILPLLHHFATLLTCSDKHDREAKKVIAVAGSVAPNQQPRALIVSQNPYLASTVGKICLRMVEKDNRPLEEVVMGAANSDLADHIADVLTALSAYDPRATNHIEQHVSLEEDSRLCGGKRLYDVIGQWKPDPGPPEIATKWVNPAQWLLRLEEIRGMKSREFKGQVQWEFSDETKRAWSLILAGMLHAVERGIESVKAAKGKTGKEAEEELRQEMIRLNRRSGYLHSLVCGHAGIVKTLLTETDVVSDIPAHFRPMDGDTTSDDLADLHQEPDENKGHQVYRYLRMVTAWHAAVKELCLSRTLPEFLNNSVVGLVEVPPSPTLVMSSEEISAGFFSRFPDMMQNGQAVSELIQSRHPATFSGCVHAEATLMALLNYYTPGLTHDHAFEAELQNPAALQQIVQPVAESGNGIIAVSNKCCWCCDWLGRNLEAEFTLPGTHGIMFPWDPPKIGVGVATLVKLEEELWQELYQAVSNALEPSYSRHSSPAGSPVEPYLNQVDEDRSFLSQDILAVEKPL